MPPPSSPQRIKRYLALTLILLIGFALRVYALQTIPNGLFIDEAVRGYDAYSISQTGADMFGEFLPLFPRSLDDYTPALYTYLTIPFVALLDLSPFSVRYAAVWVGLFTIVVAYQLLRHLFGESVGLVGAALIAISPWYILLSRIGTEWTLLGLGPMLTITLAYRGLRRPRWLVGAGVVGGISLYGYAPVKAFLPLLLLLFIALYWRELWAQRRAALIALALLVGLGLPVYAFSLTPTGRIRYQEISYLGQLPPLEMAQTFMANYVSYFDPRFLFTTNEAFLELYYIQRLKHIGLLYWFELPLILLGLFWLTRQQRRVVYFWVGWLLLAPLGINLHIHSPKPALWLTATPVLHGLAALGLVGGGRLALSALRTGDHPNVWRRRIGAAAIVAAFTVWMGLNINRMVTDLFKMYPVYSVTEFGWWAHGAGEGLVELERRRSAFDSAILEPFSIEDLTRYSGLYYAFYTQFSPAQWQMALNRNDGLTNPEVTDSLFVGQTVQRSGEPGCHLALARPEVRLDLSAPVHTLATYPRPDGQVDLSLLAVANPGTPPQPVQAIFGEQILLHSFALDVPDQDGFYPLKPGQALCLVLNWQSTGNIDQNYTVFTHLLGPFNPTSNGPLWAQHDAPPGDGLRPTDRWQPGEIVSDLHVLFVPEAAPPGQYALIVGLYDSATGQRLPVQSAGSTADSVRLLDLRIDEKK